MESTLATPTSHGTPTSQGCDLAHTQDEGPTANENCAQANHEQSPAHHERSPAHDERSPVYDDRAPAVGTRTSPNGGHTLPELIAVRDALTILAKEPLPVAYAIARNLRLVSDIIEEAYTIGKNFVDVLVGGREKSYVVVSRDDGRVLRPWAEGEALAAGEVVVHDVTEEERSLVVAYEQEMNATRHEVRWHRIPASKIEGVALPAAVLLPLLGTIIVSDETGV